MDVTTAKSSLSGWYILSNGSTYYWFIVNFFTLNGTTFQAGFSLFLLPSFLNTVIWCHRNKTDLSVLLLAWRPNFSCGKRAVSDKGCISQPLRILLSRLGHLLETKKGMRRERQYHQQQSKCSRGFFLCLTRFLIVSEEINPTDDNHMELLKHRVTE